MSRKVAPHTRGISNEMVPLSGRAVLEGAPAMASLVAGVAHEVNNPAAYVGANLSILAEHMQSVERAVQDILTLVADDPDRMKQIQSVFEQRDLQGALDDARAIVDENLEGVHRLSGFVRELQTFTRIDPKDLDFVHPNEVVNAACARVYGVSRGRAKIVQELSDVPTLVADRWRLQQAIIQLLQNALDASGAAGAAGGSDVEASNLVVVRTSATPEQVIISVSDDGEGITEAVERRLFEPFFSSRPGHRGLGLCMVATSARQHGGDVRVYSRPGEGARFDIVLPRDTGLVVPDRREPSGRSRPPKGRAPLKPVQADPADD